MLAKGTIFAIALVLLIAIMITLLGLAVYTTPAKTDLSGGNGLGSYNVPAMYPSIPVGEIITSPQPTTVGET